jgi:LPS export ABC transporter permease LptG
MLKKLDLMVAREVIAPTVLGVVTYTFLLMMRGLFSLIEQIFVRGLPAIDALSVLAVTLPHVVVLTIPMGFLFGVLLAVGRMSMDNEIVALQAGGISSLRMLRPILAVGVLLALFNGYLFLIVIPKSNRTLKELRVTLFTSAKNLGRIQPGVFYEDFPNLLLYVRGVDGETTEWDQVLVYDSNDPGEERLTLAQKGLVIPADADTGRDGSDSGPASQRSSQPWIRLENAVTHQFFRAKPATYRVNNNQELLFRPQIADTGMIRYDLAMRERDSVELIRFVRGGELPGQEYPDDEDRSADLLDASLELHRRFAVPAACIVFALLALPLGVGSRSGGRGRGFVLSVGVVLMYYVIGNNGEIAALDGKLPVWLGMWLPNIALGLLALFMMTRMGRWLGERQPREGPISRLRREWQRWRDERAAAASAPGHARPVGARAAPRRGRHRVAFRFPSQLDRYMASRLIAPLVLVMASTGALYIVVDLTEHIKAMADNDAPLNVIVAYYWNLLPQMIVEVLPFGMLIAVLIVLTVLERQQELTAFKGAGVSLFRLMIPVVLVAMSMGLVMWLLAEQVVPGANREKDRLLDVIEGKTAARSYRVTDKQWLLSRDNTTFYNFLRYDASDQTLVRLTLFRVDENMHLRFHLSAQRARYSDDGWVADAGWFRQFFPDGTDEFRRITKPMKLRIPEGPDYFGQEYSSPSEMTHTELRSYIGELEDSGYHPVELKVRWHQKFAYPLQAVMMVWLALPFGLNRGGRRVTTMQGVALALGLGIGYSILVTVFAKLGEATVLPPAMAAWAPVLLGLLFALNRMTTLRT